MDNPGLKRGLFFGAACVAIYLLTYLIAKKYLFIPGLWPITGIVFPLTFMISAARETRNMQSGFMSFGDSLSSTFLTYVIGTLIYTLFTYTMINIVDPSLLEFGREAGLEALDNYEAMLGPEQTDVFRDALEQGGESGIADHLMQWALLLIIPGFLYSAIISAIMKRDAPTP